MVRNWYFYWAPVGLASVGKNMHNKKAWKRATGGGFGWKHEKVFPPQPLTILSPKKNLIKTLGLGPSLTPCYLTSLLFDKKNKCPVHISLFEYLKIYILLTIQKLLSIFHFFRITNKYIARRKLKFTNLFHILTVYKIIDGLSYF